MKKIKIRNVKVNPEDGKLKYTVWKGKERFNYKLNLIAFAFLMDNKEFATGYKQAETEVLKKLKTIKRKGPKNEVDVPVKTSG